MSFLHRGIYSTLAVKDQLTDVFLIISWSIASSIESKPDENGILT